MVCFFLVIVSEAFAGLPAWNLASRPKTTTDRKTRLMEEINNGYRNSTCPAEFPKRRRRFPDRLGPGETVCRLFYRYPYDNQSDPGCSGAVELLHRQSDLCSPDKKRDSGSRRDSHILFCADPVCVFYLSMVPEVSREACCRAFKVKEISKREHRKAPAVCPGRGFCNDKSLCRLHNPG